ncbi:MAG TPA: OmpA family protein [Polyangiaceae bacterium]|jgi:flagellar motor protein MotB
MPPPLDEDELEAAPIWPAFGDLMACLFGIFVLFFVWTVSIDTALARDLANEKTSRAAETARREALERALAGPLAAGHITLEGGKIGIRGNVLFDLNSADLRDEGAQVLHDVAGPLAAYLADRSELVMVSGFTDDRVIHGGIGSYRDNWELSAQRALTITRALEADGIPHEALFAAGFADNHPIADNGTGDGRAKNRRVEIAPVLRSAVPR